MIYLDYAANYPASKEARQAFLDTESNYIGNANSVHPLGKRALKFFTEINEKYFV